MLKNNILKNSSPQKIVLASGNKNKIKELEQLLIPLSISITPQTELNIEDTVEDGLTFVENALIKARHASKISGLPAIADDSGLVVDALDGCPGIYSSRFAGEPSSDENNNTLLLKQMENISDQNRKACFVCVLIYLRHAEEPLPIICEGVWEGSILREQQGENGFGYDPLFFSPEHQCSSAELSAEEKAKVSHRGKAMQALLNEMKKII